MIKYTFCKKELDMRRLNEIYWNKFIKKDFSGKSRRDGLLFEELIEYLLQIEYRQEWVRTPISHDNNRDFHLTTPEFTYWAECKNYTHSIALDTIAPTLVMAQIFEVNKLIFFSYSDINSSAKNKIYSFGASTKKEIEIFSGNTLDELIIKNRDYLPKKFKPLDENINSIDCKEPLEYQFLFIQNPILGVVLEDRDIMQISDAKKIVYNTIFEIAFICTNNTLDNDYEIEMSLDYGAGTDNAYFTLVGYEAQNASHLLDKKKLPAAGGILNRYFFKSNRFKPSLILPVLQATIKKGSNIIRTINSAVNRVQNQWIGRTILIGEQYRSAVKEVEEYIVDNSECSCFMAYGESGTGKTRLLKEMLDVLLKHKYRVVSFIGNEEDSAYVLLKELIYFVYEVPREDVLKNLESDAFMQQQVILDTPAQKAYRLANRFTKAHSDSELIDVIEESFDILYEKISKEKIAIIIDNIQFFGNALIYFLQKYIVYSKHQTRTNNSVLILSINQDYITEQAEEFLKYILDLSKDRRQFSCHNIHGFQNKNQGILFLRELLHVDNESLDCEFEIILRKSSLKPYYIYQAVYYLYENNAIMEWENQKGYFPCMEKFHDVINKMPPRIQDIISKRWEICLKKQELDEGETVSLIAVLYFFRELTADILYLFHFDSNITDILVRHMFLRINENGNYCFDHDIIENFFVIRYTNMDALVVNRIQSCRAGRKLSNYPFVDLYYKLCAKNVDVKKLQQIYTETMRISLHPKLADVYFSKFLKVILAKKKRCESEELWLSMVFGVCNLAKNIIGIKRVEKYFETVNRFLEKNISETIILTNAFRNYMNIYADILFFQKKHEEAIAYLERIRDIPLTAQNDQVYALKSMVQNRLLINHRELPSGYHQKSAKDCLLEAKSYANMLEDHFLKDEFTYLNLSDEGYNYYCLYSQKEKLLSIWNRCREYPPARLPQKAMNYYRKWLQLELIQQNYQKVPDIIQEACDYMDIHYSGNMEKLNFQLSFSIYKIMALIQENPVQNRAVLLKEISHAIELSKLMAQKNLYQILAMNAIVCYYNNDAMGTYSQSRDAYNSYNRMPGSLFYAEKKSLLLANIYISFKKFDMLSKADTFLSDNNLKEFHMLNIQVSDYRAAGIQQTTDGLFNLPCI